MFYTNYKNTDYLYIEKNKNRHIL
ncbi:hypothetical protein CH1034_250046 [Klebsiella pneumoniae]|nr:hypothetical protein CH1034_250046 [Klebsiella pneumoniae]